MTLQQSANPVRAVGVSSYIQVLELMLCIVRIRSVLVFDLFRVLQAGCSRSVDRHFDRPSQARDGFQNTAWSLDSESMPIRFTLPTYALHARSWGRWSTYILDQNRR